MLETLECSHFIGFCLKRLHWKNKYDSCSSPNSPEDPRLNLRSFQEGWVSAPEVLCFHSVSGEGLIPIRFLLLFPKTVMPWGFLPLRFFITMKVRRCMTTFRCIIYFPVWDFFPLVSMVWGITVLRRKACWKWEGCSLLWKVINTCL